MLFLDLSLDNMPARSHALKIRSLPTRVHKPLGDDKEFSAGSMNTDAFLK